MTCNSNGQWNGVQPSCKKATSSTQSRYYCGAPPEMPNAKHNGTKEQVSSLYAVCSQQNQSTDKWFIDLYFVLMKHFRLTISILDTSIIHPSFIA